jgi:stringent starvation protein A
MMSHGVRLVLCEKNLPADILYVASDEINEELLELNPLGNSPTFVERDLVLYDARVIMEYLEERFPHPALHHSDPASRATARMIIKRIDQDWCGELQALSLQPDKTAAQTRKQLRESLMSAAPLFEARPYFMSEEFSLIDCVLAPLLWHLPHHGIQLEPLGQAINAYAQHLFTRKSFQNSLNDYDRTLIS